eukprot:TRINITY_DN5401_c0_g1_i6.p1 TRINITY_DN5401_c0_g1~~TRINITY_DN5401_c0_g1_i6.p1  ORF type:complete len:284 (-),score=46.31 TRINITY_DN5401_c0_g1_i6:92-943(-)
MAAELITEYRAKEARTLELNDPANSPSATRSSPRDLVPNTQSVAVPPWTRQFREWRQGSTIGSQWRTPAGIWANCHGGPMPDPSSFVADRTRRFLGETVSYARNYSPVHVQAFPYCPDHQDRSHDLNLLSGIGHSDRLLDQEGEAEHFLQDTLSRQHPWPPVKRDFEPPAAGRVTVLGTGRVHMNHTGKKVTGFVRTGSPAAVLCGRDEGGVFMPRQVKCEAIPVKQAEPRREPVRPDKMAPVWDRHCSTCSDRDCHVHRHDDVDALTAVSYTHLTLPTKRIV